MEKSCFLMFVSFFLLTAGSASATEYYVDFQSGSDSNDGLSTSTPWKHCPGDPNAIGTAVSTVLSAGDAVYFKKGVIYRGQINVNKNGLEVDSGSNAMVTASGVFTSSGQNFMSTVQPGDVVYIYHSSPTGAWINSVGVFDVYSVDSDTQLTLSGFNKLAHSTPEMTYKIWRTITFTSTSSWGSGDAVLSGRNDGGALTLWYLVKASGNYIRFKYLKFEDTRYPPDEGCTNAVYSAIYGDSGNKQGMIIDGCKFENLWRINNVNYIGYQITINNIAKDIGAIGYEGRHYGLVENNTIDDAGGGMRVGGDYSVIRGNTITNCNKDSSTICDYHSDGIFASEGSYGWIVNNLVYNGFQGIYLTYSPSTYTSYYKIANNVLIFSGSWSAGTGNDQGIGVLKASYPEIYNNIIFTLGSTTDALLRGMWITASSTGVTLRNNIIYSQTGTSLNIGIWVDPNSATGFTSDYNVVYTPAQNTPFEYGGTWISFAQWQGYGFDLHGSTSQPNLVDVIGNDYSELDLRLASTDTVAKDKGTIGLLAFDKNNIIRPQGPAWDIGAYEYQAAPTQTCSQLGGTCCQSGQVCSGTSQTASDCTTCCMAACRTPSCGDGPCDPGETCSSCPQDCDCTLPQLCCSDSCIIPACSQASNCGSNPCMTYTCSSPGTCSASCSSIPKTACVNWDSCCPAGCTNYTDSDCSPAPSGICSDLVLLHHYDNNPAYGESSNLVYDFSGNGNNGTIFGPTFNSTGGRFSGAYQFDGTNDYMRVGDLDLPGPFTLSFWLYPSAFPPSWHSTVMKSLDYGCEFSSSTLYCYTGAGGGWSATTTYAFPQTNRWYHVLVTHDGSTLTLYVDGQSRQTSTGSHTTTNNPLLIGSWGGGSEYFNGRVDELGIWNRTLSSEEIQSLYNSGSAIACMQFCIHKSDNNPCDGCVTNSELFSFISRWQISNLDVTLRDLMEAIGLWKRGC